MVNVSMDPRHDEVNLHRLLRRLEKSVQTPQEWQVYEGSPDEPSGSSRESQLRLKVQKDIQMVKYARKLMRSVEASGSDNDSLDSYGMPRTVRDGRNLHELDDVKTRLDRVESFLKELLQTHNGPLKRPPSLLSRLPKPPPPTLPIVEVTSEAVDIDEAPTVEPLAGPTDNLLLSPPELDGIPSAGVEFAYPPLYSPAASPLRPGVTATSSAVPPVPTPTSRKPQSAAHASLQEELSSQLESMAAQLKRNAIHFSSNLAKDKSVVEEAGEKLERNYDVMEQEKGRLGRLNKITSGTTWMTLGIVLVVLLLFVIMIGIIRFSRT